MNGIVAELDRLKKRNVTSMRAVRRRLSRHMAEREVSAVMDAADALIGAGYRWVGYELIHHHRRALRSLSLKDVEALGQGIDSWDTVDPFGGYIAGPAWANGQISDAAVRRWTRSADRWWRRTALVATTTLNLKSKGGTGDTERTLDIAKRLAGDGDDMIVKAMSWALRTLAPWDPGAVRQFLAEHDATLAARVKREVRNKLQTGRKNR